MSPISLSSWQVWAVLSAVFAALTAIFAKVGVEGIVEMHALVGWRLLGDRYARLPFPRGPDRSRRIF